MANRYNTYMRTRILLFSLLLLVSTHSVHAEEVNAGFVQGLWYSEDTVFANEPTRIYVALRNNTPHDLSGTIRFTDNGKRIGSSEVRALSGRLVEAWVDWTPTFGAHTIVANVSDAELHIIGGGTESIDITGMIAEDTLTVDYDTDKDGVGNETDTDDDNDRVSDEDERVRGTNPLVTNPQPTTQTETQKSTPAEERTEARISTTQNVTSGGEQGLEKYINEGTADSLLSNVTEKVENAKHSLDTYREERNAQIFAEQQATATEDGLGEYTSNATITRTKIETQNNFLSAFISGVASILQSIWTFLLWLLSGTLAHPALIQCSLLIAILYITYRVARKLGRRQKY
jgi:hypothetical protein